MNVLLGILALILIYALSRIYSIPDDDGEE